MSSLSRPLRFLAVRRGLHHRPLRLPISILPPRLVRPIKVQGPGQNSSSDQSGPTDFDNIEPNISASPTASSSQHPFAGHLNSASQSEPSSSKSVVTTLPSPPEKVFSVLPPHLQHPFDTHAFVSYLEKADLEPATARSLMEAVKLLITRRGEKTRDDMVGKEDQENVRAGLPALNSFAD